MQAWSFDKVEGRLKGIMCDVYTGVRDTAAEFGVSNNFVLGANIAGFRKVADAMIEQGIV